MGTVELIVSKRCWKFSQAGGFKHVLYLPLFGANVSIWLCLTNIFEMGWSPVVSFQPRDSLGKMNYDESIFDEHSFSFWLAWNQQRAQKNGARDASNYFPKYPNLPSQALQSLTFFGKVVGLVGQSWTQLVRHGTSSDHRNHNETTFRQVRQGQCEKLTAERDALEVSDFQKQRLVMVNVFSGSQICSSSLPSWWVDELVGGCWWFHIFFGIFTPILGKDSHFDEHIFSIGLVQSPTKLGLTARVCHEMMIEV